MKKRIFMLSILVIHSGYLFLSTADAVSGRCNDFTGDTTIEGTEFIQITSFGGYISRLHQLTRSETDYNRLLLFRLNVEEASIFEDTSVTNYLLQAFPKEIKGKNQKNRKDLWNAAAVNRFQLLLGQRIQTLLWNDSIWQTMRPYTDSSFILINIPANVLLYVNEGNIEFLLRTITGKKSTPTPVLNSRVSVVIQYPYWNIPRKIAVNEILPLIRNNKTSLRTLHLEVVEDDKVISNPETLPWKDFSSRNFPYNLRQLPGPWNALGLLKFEFPNPYHVYLHDTNDRGAFRHEKRHLSHGCIRLENPIRLALRIGAEIDTVAMAGKDSLIRPITFFLAHPVKIFVIYATLDLDKDQLKWLPDIYNKIKVEGSAKSNN